MYHIDGTETPYEEVINTILDCIFDGIPMYYAFHMGVDIIWINTPAPNWAHPLNLTPRGLECNNKIIEPLTDSNLKIKTT